MPRGGARPGTGGAQPGSGRPKGSVGQRTLALRAISDKALAAGITPLEVMLGNMRHFNKVALQAESAVEGLTVEEISGKDLSPEEQFKYLLSKVKHAAGLRLMAQECARDAAAFLHPKLSSVVVGGDPDNPVHTVNHVEYAVLAPGTWEETADRPAAGLPTAH